MQLNGIELIGYTHGPGQASFLLGCDFATANALDGQELTVTDDGTEVAHFGGYRLSALEAEPADRTRASFAQELEPNTEQAIDALQRNLEIANGNISTASQVADGARDAASRANESAAGASELANANAEAIEELAAAVFAE